MDQILYQLVQKVDVYSIFASILTLILATVVPILSFKYRKLLGVLAECKKAFIDLRTAWSDGIITNEEAKCIFNDLCNIMKEIGK